MLVHVDETLLIIFEDKMVTDKISTLIVCGKSHQGVRGIMEQVDEVINIFKIMPKT